MWLLPNLAAVVGLHLASVWVSWGEAAPLEHNGGHGEEPRSGSKILSHGCVEGEKVADRTVSTLRYVSIISSGDPDG